MRRIDVGLGALLLCACGSKSPNKDGITGGNQSPNNVTLVAPSTPRGTVSGQILTAELTGLSGATVNVSVGEPQSDVGGTGGTWNTTTDAQGNFTMQFLPAGSQATVTASASGYATVRTQVFIPVSAGNFPIDNGNAAVGPLMLTALTGQLKLLVVDHNGVPVQKAKVVVEGTPAGTDLSSTASTYGAPLGVVVVPSTTDTSGSVTVSGLPAADELARIGGNYTVTIPAILDSSGNPISGGKVVQYAAQGIVLDPSVRVIQLPDARAGAFALVSSNAQSLLNVYPPLDNLFQITDPIYLVFNQAVQQPSFTAILTNEYGTTTISTTATFSQNGNMVTLQPNTPLVAGQEYNLSIRADSLDDGSSLFLRGFFFAGDPATPVPFALPTQAPVGGGGAIEWIDQGMPGNGLLDPGEQVVVYFNESVGWTGVQSSLQLFFDVDLDNSGRTGDAQGELGFTTGFSLINDEPTNDPMSAFPLFASGYTTRWTLFYAPPPNKQITLSQSIQASAHVTVDFSKVQNSVGGIQNVWGQQIEQPITGLLEKAP